MWERPRRARFGKFVDAMRWAHYVASAWIRALAFRLIGWRKPQGDDMTATREAGSTSEAWKPDKNLIWRSSEEYGHFAMTGGQIAKVALAASAGLIPVSYTHLRAHETRHELVC